MTRCARWAWMVLLAALAGGCTWIATGSVPATLGEPAALRMGWTAEFTQEPLAVRFVAVREDDRCPTEVICDWAGHALIEFTVAAGDQEPQGLELSTYQPMSATVEGYIIELVDASPYPQHPDRPIRDDQYQVTIRATNE